MGIIYSTAYLTIIAGEGDNVDAGLGRLASTLGKAEQPLKICSRGYDLSLLPSRTRSLREILRNTTWGTRAWTFQEYLMSPRSVISTTEEVYFQSKYMDVREAYELHFGLPTHNVHNPGKPLDKYEAVALNKPDAPELTTIGVCRDSLFEGASYDALVRDYTERKSTFFGDRLDAFIGAAGLSENTTTIQERIALSGLLKKHFAQSLAWCHTPSARSTDWHTTPRRIHQNHRRTRCLPSWSWVGWTERVSFMDCAMEKECEIMDEANIVCNLAGTTWNVGPALCKRTRMLCVTLHLWTAIIGCNLTRSTPNEEGNVSVHIFNPGKPQLVIPLRGVIPKRGLYVKVYESIYSETKAAHYLVPLSLQDNSPFVGQAFIIIKQNGLVYERVGHLMMDWSFLDANRPNEVQCFVQAWASEPQYIRMR
jgi:hypothetical protein